MSKLVRHCLLCGKLIKTCGPQDDDQYKSAEEEIQYPPDNAIVWQSYGNYGSTLMDMGEHTGEMLEIYIHDECLKERAAYVKFCKVAIQRREIIGVSTLEEELKKKMSEIHLYKFQDKLKPEIFLFLVSTLKPDDEKNLRAAEHIMDHGDMPYEDWERVWRTGEVSEIVKLQDVPIDCRELVPYITDEWVEELDNYFDYCEAIADLFDKNENIISISDL